MPTARYSSFDRGFDLGHAEIPTTSSPKIERKYDPKGPSSTTWKKLLAFAMVAVMVTSAMVIIVPTFKKHMAQGPGPTDQLPATIGLVPQRIVNYTISNMFENYLKPDASNYALLGKQQGTLAFPQWYDERRTIGGYPDTQIHDTYPLVLAYDYYSASNAFKGYKNEPHMSYGLYTFFREYIKAENLTSPATGAGKNPNIIPMLSGPSGLAMNGGWVNFSWYLTYLPLTEVSDIQNGTHYANSYYKVPYKVGTPPKNPPNQSAPIFTGNDGWFNEIQGTISFNRSAAHKFLNLPLKYFDLRIAFRNNQSTINDSWALEWATDGSGNATWDIFATYDYDLLTDPPYDTYFSLDPTSTANNLVLRIWGHSWGYEILMQRYLETFGVAKYFQTYPEDFYFNGTIGPSYSNLTIRETSTYKFLAWKDMNFWAPAWNMDTWHTDASPNTASHPPTTSWGSRYGTNPLGLAGRGNYYEKITGGNQYYPRKVEWSPGTDLYGTAVMYWQPPQGFNLTARENITIKLPTIPVLGYNPFRGAWTYGDIPGSGPAIVANMSASASWGELVLGHGYPSWLYSSTYYNNVTKTMRLRGPLILNSDPNQNPTYAFINETGSPDFVYGVTRVSYYKVEVTQAGPYNAGVFYTLRVTARNLTGSTVTDWNGTVTLVTNNVGSTFGGNGSSHTYLPTENGVWFTTIRFNTPNKLNTFVNATDSKFPLDVFWAGPNQAAGGGSISIGVLIPEFPTLLIPVIGISATVAVIARRRKKDESK